MRKNRNAAQIVFAAKDKENNDNQTPEERIEDTSEASKSAAPVHKKKTRPTA